MSGNVWWISFADDERCRGVVITLDQEDEDIALATARLWKEGLNPGGEVAGYSVPMDMMRANQPEALLPENMNRIIPEAEVLAWEGIYKVKDMPNE